MANQPYIGPNTKHTARIRKTLEGVASSGSITPMIQTARNHADMAHKTSSRDFCSCFFHWTFFSSSTKRPRPNIQCGYMAYRPFVSATGQSKARRPTNEESGQETHRNKPAPRNQRRPRPVPPGTPLDLNRDYPSSAEQSSFALDPHWAEIRTADVLARHCGAPSSRRKGVSGGATPQDRDNLPARCLTGIPSTKP